MPEAVRFKKSQLIALSIDDSIFDLVAMMNEKGYN